MRDHVLGVGEEERGLDLEGELGWVLGGSDRTFGLGGAWIRSYVLADDDGTLGSVCIYQAVSPEAIRRHALRVGMPADEINEVLETVLVRPDPEPAAATA